MESWRAVWRRGFAPLLSVEALTFLETALTTGDARLLQGATTQPPPLQCVQDWPCEAADPIGLCGVAENEGWGTATVGDVEEFFARACYQADQLLGEPAACRWFLNWIDETPREEAFPLLLAEVSRELARRSRRAVLACAAEACEPVAF